MVQLLKSSVVALFILFSVAARAEEPPATHSFDDAAKADGSKGEDAEALTRQQALVQGMRSMGIARFPLERIARLMEERPNATAEQFNKLVDLANEAMPGAMTAEQKDKLKRLYKEELGQVKTAPGSEFVAAAKLLAGKLPVKEQPLNPPANPNVPQDPKNAVSTLNGASVLQTPPTPGKGPADSFGEAGKGGKGSLDAEALKALEGKLTALQAGLAAQQQLGQPKGEVQGGGESQKKGLLDNLLGLLRGDKGKGEKEKGGRGERGGDKGREHGGPPPGGGQQQAKDDDDKPLKQPEKRERDRDRDRQRGGGQLAQQGNSKEGSGSDKKEGDKKEKAEPIIQAGELSKEKKEKPKEEKAETKEEKPEDDALANAQNLLLSQPKKKRSLGPGKVGELIAGGNQGGGGGGGEAPADAGGGGGGGAGPVVGGGGGGAGGGGGGGDVPMVGGDDGGGGAAPQTFNFVKMTDFGSASGGGDGGGESPSSVDGGYDEPPTAPRPRGAMLAGSEPLRLHPAVEAGRGWVLDYVGHWKKKICEGPDKAKVAVCYRLPRSPMSLAVKAASALK